VLQAMDLLCCRLWIYCAAGYGFIVLQAMDLYRLQVTCLLKTVQIFESFSIESLC